MAKKKLLMILGAGSSVDLGVPSVGKLDEQMRTWAQEEARASNAKDFFNELRASIEGFCRANPDGIRRLVDYEEVLGCMMDLARWKMQPPFESSLRAYLDPARPFDADQWKRLDQQYARLIKELAKYFRDVCLIGFDPGKFKTYGNLIERLRGEFDLGIYSLNYDDVAHRAWPEAFVGFDLTSGEFDSPTILARREWDFIYHLHGSVHYSLRSPRHLPGCPPNILWVADLKAQFHDAFPEEGPVLRSNLALMRPTTLVVGGHKLDQMLAEPWQTLHATLVRHAYEADAIVFAGYGFGDTHVNFALRNGRVSSRRQAPVMIIDLARRYQNPGKWCMDSWLWNMMEFTNILDGIHPYLHTASAGDLAEPLYANNALTVSRRQKHAIWHGGFLGAHAHIDQTITWLNGDSAAFDSLGAVCTFLS